MERCVGRGIDLIGRFNLETGFQTFGLYGSRLGFLRGYKGLQNSSGLCEVNHNNCKTYSSLGLSQGGTQNIFQSKLRCLHMFFFYKAWIYSCKAYSSKSQSRKKLKFGEANILGDFWKHFVYGHAWTLPTYSWSGKSLIIHSSGQSTDMKALSLRVQLFLRPYQAVKRCTWRWDLGFARVLNVAYWVRSCMGNLGIGRNTLDSSR